MSFDTKHPEYLKMAEEWQMIDDALAGEIAVKKAGVKYLPMTAGMINAKDSTNINVNDLYNAYRLRAQYPEWVRDSIRSMVGLVSRIKSKQKLEHNQIVSMAFNASSDGFPLHQVFVRTVLNVIKKGRYGLLCDIDDAGKPLIALYEPESIINWKFSHGENGRSDLSLLVLREKVAADKDDIFSHDVKSEYLVYEVKDGVCVSYRLNERGNFLEEEHPLSTNSNTLGFIPFVFVGSVDNAPDVDVVPLLTMVKSAIKYYQLSADYYQELHLTAHPQPVITGEDLANVTTLVTGPMMAWNLPADGAKAFYLEISGSGIEAKRQAMDAQKNAALEAGARVMDIGGNESGQARMARQNDQYATLQAVVKNSAEAIEQCLRYLGEWYGLTPEQANQKLAFTVDLDFNKVVDTAMLQQLFSAAQLGMISPETVWEYMQTGQVPERNWDDEQGRILNIGLDGKNGNN